MKKVMLAVVSCILFGTLGWAGENSVDTAAVCAAESRPAWSPGEMAEKALAELKAPLQLSEEQLKKLQPLFTQHFTNVLAVREKYKDGGFRALRAMRREMEALREQNDKKLQGILSEPQMVKFKEMRDGMKKQLGQAVKAKQNQKTTDSTRANTKAENKNADKP